MSQAFQKAKNYQNLTTESRSKKLFVTGKTSHSGSVPIRTQAVSIKAQF